MMYEMPFCDRHHGASRRFNAAMTEGKWMADLVGLAQDVLRSRTVVQVSGGPGVPDLMIGSFRIGRTQIAGVWPPLSGLMPRPFKQS